jgi:hypothetical protein
VEPKKVYFAGDLFDHKHLTGNLLLKSALEKQAVEKDFPLEVILPQDLEQFFERSVDVRNNDILTLLLSDLAIFHFDGTDLDSGTVVEFILAKMLDIPSVIVRTDIRIAGDQAEGDPWNLMVSGFPRAEVVLGNALQLYKAAGITGMHSAMAADITSGLQKSLFCKTLFSNEQEILTIYNHALKMSGSGFIGYFSQNSPLTLQEIVHSKIEKGIYCVG